MSGNSTKKRVDQVPEKKKRVQEKETTEQGKKRAKKIKYRRRRFPILLRVVVIILLLIVSLAAGLAFGYSVLGDGTMMDVFEKETWQHIIDIVNLEE